MVIFKYSAGKGIHSFISNADNFLSFKPTLTFIHYINTLIKVYATPHTLLFLLVIIKDKYRFSITVQIERNSPPIIYIFFLKIIRREEKNTADLTFTLACMSMQIQLLVNTHHTHIPT